MKLNIDGIITGTFNESDFKARTSGFIDTSGESFNHFELSFIVPIPKHFNPILAGHCYASSYNCLALLPISPDNINIENVFALNAGYYTSSRSVRYESLGKENYVDFKSQIKIEEGVASTTESTIEGNYNGPLDLLGVTDCSQVWKKGVDDSEIIISTTANILRANGEKLPIKIETIYGKLIKTLAADTLKARFIYGNEKWDGSVMSFDSFGILYI